MDWLCLAKEVGNAASETCKPIILDKIKECYSNIKYYKENLKLVQEKYNDLKKKKYEIDCKVEREEDNLGVLTQGAKGWLEKVKRAMEEVEKLTKKLTDEEERKSRDKVSCFRHSRCSLCRRYNMSKEAKSKADEIDDIMNHIPTNFTEPVSRSDLKSIPNEFLKSLRSRVELMEDILKKLRDDDVNAVGIFGMGAIGKTTLVKEISNYNDMTTMFEEIIMVEIFEAPNLERIQDRIAENIGLNLGDFHSVEERARRLLTELKTKSKVLIILDNVWSKLELGKVGIPKPNDKSNHFCCKLLVTSREKPVCDAMEVSRDNILEVKPLINYEAKQLFRARIGAKATTEDGWKEQHEDLEERLLKRCGGLPLSIVAVADALKKKELEAWKSFATELEKPMSNSLTKIGSVHRQAYSILETSYKLMEDEKKKRFFLLACLFSFGASIPVEDMMRYGIGLELFENVDNLIEAMEQANRWVEELKSSSLLLADDEDGGFREAHVKIHDVVRASTTSLAKQGGDMVMVEAFPRWQSLETSQKYYAISLMSDADHSRLDGLNSDKLQILILDRSQPRDGFSDGFFQGMANLKVLVLKGMKFRAGLPNSIRKLKRSLRTLLMEECELGDITGIGELTNLVVLSFRKSSMEEIPEAVGNLCNLRLLDLSDCWINKKGITANVLSKLSLLEGLYALSPYERPWRYNNDDDDSKKGEYSYYARIAELNNLSFLKLLKLVVAYNDWPIDDDDQLQFLNNLDHFHISFGYYYWPIGRGYSRALRFYDNDSWSSIGKYNGVIRVLLEKTQYLYVYGMKELQHINDDIQQQEEDETKMQLSNIHFPLLQLLEVAYCPKMQSLSSTPFEAPKLADLFVEYCDNMKYIFMEHDADHQPMNAQGDPHSTVTHPCLTQIILRELRELESLTGLIKSSNTTNDDHQPSWTSYPFQSS